ncbi:DGQHR domain-containing protein [Vibrio vulnificus]|nr:DGQHR domain-containing protein [Vibrio vulnificus]
MSMNESLNLTQLDMPAPNGLDLPLVMHLGKEGLSESTPCDIYETVLTYSELTQHFDIEQNSDEMNEYDKCQRDVDKARVKGVTHYFHTRADTILPAICIFVTQLDDITQYHVAGKPIVSALLKADRGRFISDGQGRTATLKQLLQDAEKAHLSSHTIAAKIIVTNTPTLAQAATTIRQVFSDFNGNVKTPSSSISLFFDSSKPFSNLIRTLVNEIHLQSINKPLRDLIAANGAVKEGQLWTYKQFADFVCRYLDSTIAEMNKTLTTPEALDLVKEQLIALVANTIDKLPLNTLTTEQWKTYHQKALFTKALFANGLAYTARCLAEEAMIAEESINWAKMHNIAKAPIDDMAHAEWLKFNVTYKDETSNKQTIKIMKGCDKRIARVLCAQMKIMPSLDI